MPKKVVKKAPARKTTKPRKNSGATTSKRIRAASKRVTKSHATPSLTEDVIRERAYEISCRRGGTPDPIADWFQAEQELLTEIGS
jgi:hypothetical protein